MKLVGMARGRPRSGGGKAPLIGRTPGRQAAARQPSASTSFEGVSGNDNSVDLERRRDQLRARVAELQFDLGGLVYEMAIRDRIRVDVLVRRAATLQDADAELGEVERILRVEQTSTAGECANCKAPHSSGAAFCWQCGQPILPQIQTEAIATP